MLIWLSLMGGVVGETKAALVAEGKYSLLMEYINQKYRQLIEQYDQQFKSITFNLLSQAADSSCSCCDIVHNIDTLKQFREQGNGNDRYPIWASIPLEKTLTIKDAYLILEGTGKFGIKFEKKGSYKSCYESLDIELADKKILSIALQGETEIDRLTLHRIQGEVKITAISLIKHKVPLMLNNSQPNQSATGCLAFFSQCAERKAEEREGGVSNDNSQVVVVSPRWR